MQQVYDTAVSTNLLEKGNVKVRIHLFEYYTTGNTKDDFIHVFANILEGRTIAQKKSFLKKKCNSIESNVFWYSNYLYQY